MDCFIRQQFHGLRYRFLLIVLFFQPFTLVAAEGQAQQSPSPWWIWPLILLLVTFLMGDRRSAWRSRRRSSFCSNHQRFLSLPPGFCEGNRIAGGAFMSLGSRSRIAQIQPGQLAPGDADCLDRFNHGHRRCHGRARFTHTHHPTQSGRNDSRHRRNHAFCQ